MASKYQELLNELDRERKKLTTKVVISSLSTIEISPFTNDVVRVADNTSGSGSIYIPLRCIDQVIEGLKKFME